MQDKVGAVLVIGGGVGGIRTSLDLAESGFKVYLTDRSPSIGGTLYQLETWFPDNQCELCKLLPVFDRDECSQFCLRRDLNHPNVELIPNSSVVKLAGDPGNFKVSLNVKSRWVNEEKCTACGLCAQVCPVEVSDDFNRGLQKRKAAYVYNPQAVPNVYTIDREHCNKCGKCVTICPTKAIALNMPDAKRELSVGAVVISSGSKEYAAGEMAQYGFGRYPNVVTNIQLERLLADAGPTGGKLQRPSDGKAPKKIAILQCIGSRDKERGYCSEVCCMFALKESMMLKKLYPDAEVAIYYMDMRAFGKDYYRYFLQAQSAGVKFVRCRVSRIRENPKTNDLFLLARAEDGKSISSEYDMVVLSAAQCQPQPTIELNKALNIRTNEWGFVETLGFYMTRTSRNGVFVSGSASGPSDICETVLKSSAAACEAATIIASARHQAEAKQVEHEHNDGEAEEAKIAIFVCHCGEEIGAAIDFEKTLAFAKNLPNVTLVEDVGFLCLPETLEKVKQSVTKSGANRVIMAACAPYHYQRLFTNALKEVGIDASMWQLVNFREQLAWVHKNNKALATGKAQGVLAMAVQRLKVQELLTKPSMTVTPRCLVIGGGISGLTSALSLAGQGFEVEVVEKTGELGGHSREMYFDLMADSPQTFVKNTIEKVKADPKIKLNLNSELVGVSGYAGNYKSQIKSADGKVAEIAHGAIIIATGAKNYQPTEYLYGKDKRVITQHELQKRLAEGKLDKAATVVMIQCVGSRNEAHQYCNRICCSEAITNAVKIKEQSPETQVFILNRDIMTYGFRELNYTKARESGVLFQRFEADKEPKVNANDKTLTVEVADPALPGKLEIDADLLVLSTGYVAENNQPLAKMLNVELNEDGFFKEMDPKFRPVDAVIDGIFITGLANASRNLGERVLEAQAAAQRAANLLSRKQVASGRVISEVDARRCSCCGICVEVCPFEARFLDEENKVAVVKETLCQGCGICVTACPNSAAKLRSLKDKQVFSMIEAAF
ncbi:MAG: FAD-dependent oxidoreductase [Dehalococcoidales bacterium]|nr:FAD-dependent oxidoreductase [Dehalococcoidales bacterium]